MDVEIRPMQKEDWSSVASIYRQGIETGNATFQKEMPEWEVWDSSHLKKCRIIACAGKEVIGWAALTPVSGRCVYSGVAEVSVYVSDDYKGLRVGTKLLMSLISESEIEGFWTLQAGIFPENAASLKLHERLGFRKVGIREKIGQMDNKWRDTVLLERRSRITGI
jgi:phosphinothricin acetyltransferase